MCAAVYAECPPGSAAELAPLLFKHMQIAWGGSDVYLPAFDPRPTRNSAIRAAFNGRNLAQVCRQFEVSPTTVYRIVKPADVRVTSWVTDPP